MDSEDKGVITNLATIQRAAFPNSFASKLGLNFIKKNIEWYVNNKQGYIFYLKKDGVIVGFVGAYERNSIQQPGSTSQIFRYSFFTAILSACFHPHLFLNKTYFKKSLYIFKFFKNLLAHPEINSGLKTSFSPYVGLVVIAIAPEYQGHGYGKILLGEFDTFVSNKGYNLGKLSVEKSNISANKAYRKSGWIYEGEMGNLISYYKKIGN